MDETDVLPPIYLNGEMIPVVDSDKHLEKIEKNLLTDSRSNKYSSKIEDTHHIHTTYILLQIKYNNNIVLKRIFILTHNYNLGNYISTNITDRHIIDNIYDLYLRSNRVISDFKVCDSSTLDSLHRTYCIHMYGSELWDLNCNNVKDIKVA